MNTKMYEVQVRDDGEYTPISIDGRGYWETRAAAQAALEKKRRDFPYRIYLRIRLIK